MQVPRTFLILVAGFVVVGGVALIVINGGGRDRPPAEATGAPPSAQERTPAPPPPAEAPVRRETPPARSAPRVESPVPAVPRTGTLRVESDVPDTSVFIDRKFLGKAPLTINDVEPGSHTILASPAGYDSMSETIDVAPGERDVTFKFREIRLDARIGVTHKHGMGSCRGTLSASPTGLTYTTDDRDDAFTVALTNLETFEVDYLNNNLRVKVRGGKTYNFEDPDQNKDRLFVFHRDVDKVRQRLLGGG